MVQTIFSTALGQVVLVFILIFTIVFAVLQKSKLFGADKKQIDALIGLAVGLIVTSYGYANDLISNILPVMAIGLVVILAFLMLWAFVWPNEEFKVAGWVKWVVAAIAAIVVIVTMLILTDTWNSVISLFSGSSSTWLTNIIFVVLIIAAVAVALFFGKDSSKAGKE